MNKILFIVFFVIIAASAIITFIMVLTTYVVNTNVKVSNAKFVYPQFLISQLIQSPSYTTNAIGGQLFSFSFSTPTSCTMTISEDKNLTLGEQFLINTHNTNVSEVILTSNYYNGTDGKPLNITIPVSSSYFGYLVNIDKKIISGYMHI